MAILFTVVGVAFAATLVLGIFNKDDNTDMDYLEDCQWIVNKYILYQNVKTAEL